LSKERNDKGQHGKAPDHSQPPVCHEDIKWPSVYPVRIEPSPDDDKKYAREQFYMRWQLYLNSITAAAAVIGLLGLFLLWGQLKATKKSADAADAALKSQQISFQTDQRPYVVTDGMPQFLTIPNVKAKTQANVVFKDIGKTPATNAVWFVDLLPYRAETRAGFLSFLETSFVNLRKRRDETIRTHAGEMRRDISPTTTTFSTQEARPLLAREMDDLTKGDGSFILLSIGIVNYTDGFNGAYETEFCYFFAGPDTRVWHLCDAHNTIK
jgi:hypothetical protein